MESEETAIMEMEKADPVMLGIDIDRRGDSYIARFIVDGATTPMTEMSLTDLKLLKQCLYDMIDKIDAVNTLNRCPLCDGLVKIKSNMVGIPILMVGGKIVCGKCSLSMRIPKGLDETEATDWWNRGRNVKKEKVKQ